MTASCHCKWVAACKACSRLMQVANTEYRIQNQSPQLLSDHYPKASNNLHNHLLTRLVDLFDTCSLQHHHPHASTALQPTTAAYLLLELPLPLLLLPGPLLLLLSLALLLAPALLLLVRPQRLLVGRVLLQPGNPPGAGEVKVTNIPAHAKGHKAHSGVGRQFKSTKCTSRQ